MGRDLTLGSRRKLTANLDRYYVPNLGHFASDQAFYSVDEIELGERTSPTRAEHLDTDLPARLIALDDAGVAAVGPHGRTYLVQGLLDPAPHCPRVAHRPDYIGVFSAYEGPSQVGSRITIIRVQDLNRLTKGRAWIMQTHKRS